MEDKPATNYEFKNTFVSECTTQPRPQETYTTQQPQTKNQRNHTTTQQNPQHEL